MAWRPGHLPRSGADVDPAQQALGLAILVISFAALLLLGTPIGFVIGLSSVLAAWGMSR